MPKKSSPKPAYEENKATRPPVVVVLGHVDHGKTTLLDTIRKTEVAAREYGGITQSIGAYQAAGITFIDTPGHEAFSKMRSRGAMVADIAVLVVAANDSVMPQTVESIKIIKEAKIPYIVAVNKMDLPEANLDKVIKDLLRHEVLLEGYGGDVPYVKVSAKKGDGVKELLDLIRLLAEVSGITGSEEDPLEAYVIESKLDKNRGAVATIVVKKGKLVSGQEIFIEGQKSKIRALFDYKNEALKIVGPGMPAEIIGLSVVPSVGAMIGLSANVLVASTVMQKSTQEGDQSLSLILKADSFGSLEAISAIIPANVNLLTSGVGDISEADILLAKSTKGIVLGFNVKAVPTATKLAEIEKVLVRTYKVIYELLDELTDAAAGMLEPIETEEVLGKAKIVAEFPFEKMRICGVKVVEGRVARGDMVKIGEAKSRIKSLRVGKDEGTKVEAGKECGLLLDPQVDFKLGDDIISYRIV